MRLLSAWAPRTDGAGHRAEPLMRIREHVTFQSFLPGSGEVEHA